MTEFRIYELLNEIGNNSKVLKANDYHKLKLETVGNISKTITSILYATLKDKNSTAMSKRLDLIQLIRKWCVKDRSHFYPDAANYTCFLKCLKINNVETQCNELDDFLQEELKDCDLFNDGSSEYAQFYKYCDQRNVEKRQRLGAILDADQILLGEIEYTTMKKDVHADSFENFVSCLFGFANENNVFEGIVEKKVERCSKALMESRRASRISIAYAVLNLPRNNLTTCFITSVINAISAEFNKSQDEIDLIEYMVVKAGDLKFNAEFQASLLKKFPFVYERWLIRLCTDTLLENQSEMIQRDYLSAVIKLSRENHWLKMKILTLLYELFALSNYNELVLNVVKDFE